MKRPLKIILILFLIALMVYAASVSLCKLEEKCKNCDQTSTSITESKKNNFFLNDYDIDKSIFKLKYYSGAIKINRIWAERTWKYPDCDKIFNSKLKPGERYNIIVEFSKPSDLFLFSLTPIINGKVDLTNGGIEEKRKTMRFDKLPTELKLILEEKNPDKNIGWQKGIISDTLALHIRNVR